MEECIFCSIASGEVGSHKIYENEHVFAFLDNSPASEYHTLVIPKAHYNNIFDTSEKDLKEIASAIKYITTMYKEKLGIENVQIINNSGEDAQQEVFHTHFHIIPRYKNDGLDIHQIKDPKIKDKLDELMLKLK